MPICSLSGCYHPLLESSGERIPNGFNSPASFAPGPRVFSFLRSASHQTAHGSSQSRLDTVGIRPLDKLPRFWR